MEKNDTLLTIELFESIISEVTQEMAQLKQQQGDTMSKITVEKETLKTLKKRLRQVQKEIRTTRKNIWTDKNNLRKINKNLKDKKNIVFDLNSEFVSEEDRYINLNVYREQQTKKR